jgi:hypothetical protein
MNANALVPVFASIGLSLAASTSLAHHAFSAQFDAEKPIRLIGTVTKVEWRNPHTWFFMDVEDDAGNRVNWGLELASPNLLMRNGWTRTSMNVGDVVTVEGFHARDRSNTGNARSVIHNATGESILTGSRSPRRSP